MDSNGPNVRSLNHVAHHPVGQNGVVQIKATEPVAVNGNANEGSSSPGADSAAAGKLFVGGLSWQTSSEKLRQYFGMFGNITDVLIMKDPVTQVRVEVRTFGRSNHESCTPSTRKSLGGFFGSID